MVSSGFHCETQEQKHHHTCDDDPVGSGTPALCIYDRYVDQLARWQRGPQLVQRVQHSLAVLAVEPERSRLGPARKISVCAPRRQELLVLTSGQLTERRLRSCLLARHLCQITPFVV